MSHDTEMAGNDGPDGREVDCREVRHGEGCDIGWLFSCICRPAGNVFRCAHAHGGRFQQGIAGKPVRAMQPRAGGFAGNPKARQRASASAIGGDAAHMVMHRRADRHEFAGGVYPCLPAEQVDRGETGGKARAERLAGIEKDPAAAQHFAVDGAGDNIARGKFRTRNISHETFAVLIK
ncbi:hypothetical protein D3C72_1278090 [compost metagenome]